MVIVANPNGWGGGGYVGDYGLAAALLHKCKALALK